MLQIILDHRFDCIVVAGVLLATMVAVHFWIRKKHDGRGVHAAAWIMLIALIAGGSMLAEYSGNREKARLRSMLEGFAPTYALEMQRQGHSRINYETSPDDPQYLALIESQIRWQKVNPAVNDIYTFRLNDAGNLAFLVDSETDYDRNGAIETDREARTEIGEEYDETTENMLAALEGTACFDDEPYTDRWGTWVSAYAPIYDDNGELDGALGVDYNAGTWLYSIAVNRAAMLGPTCVLAAILIASTNIISLTKAELARRMIAERKLMEASRQAGMAEIATGVLHNVGNVLNSVNVSANLASEKLRKSRVPALGKAAAMIREHEHDLGSFLTTDAKGKQLPAYITQLADHLAAEQESVLGELASLHKSVEHIVHIVASQQQFARNSECNETFELHDVLEEAVRISFVDSGRHDIQLVRNYRSCPSITADRHKILQILVNFVSNAKKAVKNVAATQRTITLSIESRANESGACCALVSVADSGVGIAAENMPRIFTHGFTTNYDGHGFGLHSCANAAKQLGGSISAHSDGAGHGARFTLELPAGNAATNAQQKDVANV